MNRLQVKVSALRELESASGEEFYPPSRRSNSFQAYGGCHVF
jgi:hypothetical protein